MSDNTAQNGTATIRALDRQAGGIETQVVQLDLGGGSGNAERLITAGQQTMANSVPVAIASDQGRMGMVQLTGGTVPAAMGVAAGVAPYGYLRVTNEAKAMFTDPFDTYDQSTKWNGPGQSGMTIGASAGNFSITTTQVNSNSAYVDTRATFTAFGHNFLTLGTAMKLEAQSSNLFALNQHRFIGFGDRPATFNTTTPLTNAIGFEIATDGKLYAVVYSNGTRVYNTAVDLLGNTLNSLVTPSTGFVRLGLAVRADTIFWYLGTMDYPCAKYDVSTAGFTLPQTQALPVRFAAVNAGTGTVGISVFALSALAVGDTGGNSFYLSDADAPWRRAVIKPASTPAAAADASLVVALSPNTISSFKLTDGLGNFMPVGDSTTRAVVMKLTDGTNIPSAKAANAAPNGVSDSSLVVQQPMSARATYIASAIRLSTGALTAATLKPVMSFEHAAGSTKTMRLIKLLVSGMATSVVAGTVEFQITRGTAASSAGSAITPTPANPAKAAADTSVKSLPTITAATNILAHQYGSVPATANSSISSTPIDILQGMDPEMYEMLTLRASNLDSIVLNAFSSAAITLQLNIVAVFTEE